MYVITLLHCTVNVLIVPLTNTDKHQFSAVAWENTCLGPDLWIHPLHQAGLFVWHRDIKWRFLKWQSINPVRVVGGLTVSQSARHVGLTLLSGGCQALSSCVLVPVRNSNNQEDGRRQDRHCYRQHVFTILPDIVVCFYFSPLQS